MPQTLQRLILGIWLAVGGLLWGLPALAAGSSAVVMLTNAQPATDLQGQVDSWLESDRGATIQEVVRAKALFTSHTMGQPFEFHENNTVWIRLRLQRTAGETDPWILNIPVPFLDEVSLFQREGNGAWTEQVAGDMLPHTLWSRQGLTPAFNLSLNGSNVQEVYLRVRNYARSDVPLRISTEDAHFHHQSNESLALGMALGLLITLTGLSLVRFTQHSARPDLSAFGYTLLVVMTVAQINGVLNATLWQSMPLVANAASRVIAPIAVGGSLLYIRELYALSIHYHRFDRFLGSMGLAAIVFAVGVLLLDPLSSNQMESLIFVTATAVALCGAVLSWRAGSVIWGWLMLATMPQALCVLWVAAEDLNLVLPMWEVRYIASFCLVVSVPTLAFALSKLTHDRKEREQRLLHLATQDALTGLLTREVFTTQLEDALHRVREQREPVALVLVSLVNHAHIVANFGPSMGEQCELRAVVKLHRVLRDVDPASRIQAGKFALLLEGVKTRELLNVRMVSLIASGLTPQPGLQPPVPLHFHAACVLLHERPLDACSALDALLELLSTMAAGTRRPIRFIDAQDTQPLDTSRASPLEPHHTLQG